MMSVYPDYFHPYVQVARILAVVCVYGFAGILIHELGHAVAAILLGFRMVSMRVGPIRFSPQNEEQWLFNQGSWNSGDVHAQFRSLPGGSAALRYFAFVVGGPLANVGTAVLLAHFSSDENFIGKSCMYLTLSCIILALASLVPLRSKSRTTSDGEKLFWILFSRKRREDFVFRLSLRARVDEIKALIRSREVEKAMSKYDDFASRYLALPGVKPEAVQQLSKLRETLQELLAGSRTLSQ